MPIFGGFGEHFPYSNFHNLNQDWIIKIVKDFLDQYTNIQTVIENGLTDLENKKDELEALLQEWYDTHSEDIANQLADALEDLNEWYTLHQNYLDATLASKTNTFNTMAEAKTAQCIESIPSDYTALSTEVSDNTNIIETNISKNNFGIQLVNPLSTDYHAGKRWNSSGGLSNADNTTVAYLLPVSYGERYCANYYPAFTYFWDGNTNTATPVTLEYYTKYYETDLGEIFIPANTTHLMATLANTATCTPMIFKVYNQYYYKPTNFKVDYGKPVINYPTMDNRFKGQKYYSFGDSITYYDKHEYVDTTSVAGSMCQGYQHFIQAVTGFDSYNHGISGADSSQILTEVQNTNVSDATLVTIMTGVNDFARSVPIATFKQNLREMIYKIQVQNPRCTLVLLSNTFGHFDQYGYISRDYADAMEEIAIEGGLPFIDNMKNNGINANNLSQFMADLPATTYSIHPNCDGFARIGRQIANRILELIK